MSERKITEGRLNLDYKTMSIELGAYVQLFEETKKAHRSSSVRAVILNSSKKIGEYYSMSLRI